jgi:hypothetical protein
MVCSETSYSFHSQDMSLKCISTGLERSSETGQTRHHLLTRSSKPSRYTGSPALSRGPSIRTVQYVPLINPPFFLKQATNRSCLSNSGTAENLVDRGKKGRLPPCFYQRPPTLHGTRRPTILLPQTIRLLVAPKGDCTRAEELGCYDGESGVVPET